jgi:hypothetical protein
MFSSVIKYVCVILGLLIIGGAFIVYKHHPIADRVLETASGILTGKPNTETPVTATPFVREGKYILVNLNNETVELHDGSSMLASMSIVAQGPQGKYYETIGGEYHYDYRIRNHFSSIGHVYMPYSVHVFGNFFIHGIPYYPDGTKVDSTYSGGCIRLEDTDAQAVYNFVEPGMTIIITRGTDADFLPTATSTEKLEDMNMTRLMTAIISLEVLPQDNDILDTDRVTVTTRRRLIPRLLEKNDDSVSTLYTNALSEKVYVDYMNQKAQTMGLTNTVFTSVTSPATTSKEDQERFVQYVSIYKSYLLQFTATSTE